jgi:hypothetical protein
LQFSNLRKSRPSPAHTKAQQRKLREHPQTLTGPAHTTAQQRKLREHPQTLTGGAHVFIRPEEKNRTPPSRSRSILSAFVVPWLMASMLLRASRYAASAASRCAAVATSGSGGAAASNPLLHRFPLGRGRDLSFSAPSALDPRPGNPIPTSIFRYACLFFFGLD